MFGSLVGERAGGGVAGQFLISDYQFRPGRFMQLFRVKFVFRGSIRGFRMSVLVTGGAGYIGGHMALGLLDAGETVVILDNLSTGFAWAVPEGAKLIVGDTGDKDLVEQLIREHAVDAIAHFAAKIVVPDSVRDPLGYYLNNVANARSLIEAAVNGGVKTFIFSSTAAVYGETGAEPVSEEAPLAPISPYGRSKLMVEWMLEDTSRAYDFRYVALRYFNVAGADPQGRLGQSTPNATHLIKRAVQTALGIHPKIEIFGQDYPTRDGTCVRDYIQVTDLIDAHLRALGHLRAGGLSVVCNCGYGHGETVKEVVEVVKRVSGVDFPVALSGRRPGDPAAIVAKADRARSVLGWKPTRDNLDEIVRQALDWERRLHNRRLDGAP
jgi:UDP-glucose 4-epimerase